MANVISNCCSILLNSLATLMILKSNNFICILLRLSWLCSSRINRQVDTYSYYYFNLKYRYHSRSTIYLLELKNLGALVYSFYQLWLSSNHIIRIYIYTSCYPWRISFKCHYYYYFNSLLNRITQYIIPYLLRLLLLFLELQLLSLIGVSLLKLLFYLYQLSF